MTKRAYLVPVVFGVAALITVGLGARQEKRHAEAMLEAATTLLESLTPEQRAAASFPFDGEDRLDWHFIPRERKGVPLKTMTPVQREAALGLVRASLSTRGFAKSEEIRQLEGVLFEREGRAIRDTEMYFVMIFGEPAAGGTWAWRYEGHHLSHSWTIVNGRAVASSPQFFGTNPAHVREGRLRGTRVLSTEEDMARSLMASLSAELRSQAIVSAEAPRDMLTANERTAAMQDNSGLTYGQLDAEQQATLWSLIEEYAGAQPTSTASARLADIRTAGFDGIRFAWMGGEAVGEGHYYRIQGPTFLIEYDNVQNDGNHVHSVWRDFEGDFGRDLLSAHYRAYPHGPVNADD